LKTSYSIGLIPLIAYAHLSATVPPPAAPAGAAGYARYTVRDNQLKDHVLKKDTQLLELNEEVMELLVPLENVRELDKLAVISHEATGFCGSLDYYPPGYQLAPSVTHKKPYFAASAHFDELESILSEVQLSKMDETITTLTTLPSRFHRHSTGKDASQTVTSLFQAQLASPTDWVINEFPHQQTQQRSVIARLPGTSSDTIVLGAHLDSIVSGGIDPEAIAPGADDDASGIAILTEIMRIIEARQLRFHKTIELHGYAAEEIGLVGSREIAAKYRTDNKIVDAMLQFDMAYYSRASDNGTLFFLEDFTSLDLTRNGIQWIKHYMGDVYRRGAMPKGAASDHKAWYEQGYPTLFPFENALADNPYIHSPNDSRDKFDDGTRMQRMVQFGLLFLAYNAGLKSLDTPYVAEQERLQQLPVSADLFLAVDGASGDYAFAVSAPQSTSFLEFCQTESAIDQRCSTTRQRLTHSETINGRKVFQSDGTIVFKADEKWRVEAYDAADVLLSRRQITWQTP